ncbi:MAG: diphosphomevalonate decarboxylase [Gammaproteobacteria bacterium TMED243]|jgi:diphosphomevalonate decarboxylase|nr:diphosphomevalonate decarboxylase [Gammaproteobacteria bacterium]RPG32761.1 MAG: diphosphomevalonate decarboxylase [Gammaproteobacteria bacterium TMED243]|tara:strand:- start:191 stop:1126 length:936 start_codon:yes stop_codon:yes gene_type:complete
MTTAHAHPNIALVKYWGKQEKPGNLPATPNLSISLAGLTTVTHVSDAPSDTFILNSKETSDPKLVRWLEALRGTFDVPPLQIDSGNDFPTSAGLASSASGFAALITAINAHCDLGLNQEMCSEWARVGSASAARSIFGGFVALVPPQWQAIPMAKRDHWPLEVVVAVTSNEPKSVNSGEGMERSRLTSPYYNAWVRDATTDFAAASEAIERRDFLSLAAVAELNCLKMHSIMLTSQPTLSYWTPASIACMDRVRSLREEGHDVFFTVDAGPQIKAVCLPASADAVASALSETPGVLEVIRSSLGEGARVVL